MPAGPSQMNRNDLLVDFSKHQDSFVKEVEEEEEEEGGMIPTPMTTLTPLLPKLQVGNSMERNQRFSQETGK